MGGGHHHVAVAGKQFAQVAVLHAVEGEARRVDHDREFAAFWNEGKGIAHGQHRLGELAHHGLAPLAGSAQCLSEREVGPGPVMAQRMLDAAGAARDLARGREIVCVSHQLPIWIVRQRIEDNRLWHDPRKRQCTLCSITSFGFSGDDLVEISYAEPAIDLIPTGDIAAPFSAGDAPEENKPEGTPPV